MATVILSNLQVDEEPLILSGNPNNIQLSVDIIINTNDTNLQQYFYEVRNSQNEIIAMQIHPQDHKIKPNTKVKFKIGINQPSKNAYFPDGDYILNAWSVSTWTGRRFDWKQPLANLGHTGIKEWNRSSNVASISKKVSRTKLVVDPSTSAGYRTNTLKYGYEKPEPQVEKDCPMYCNIVYVPTNTVAYSGLCSCSMLENYQSDPDYRVDQISKRETKPDYRGTQPEPEKLYTVHGQTLQLSQSAVDYYESLGVAVTTAEIDPYVPPTELPFVTKKPPSVFQPVEPEVTTSQVEPPEFHDISSAEEESRKYELWEQQQFAKESEQERLDRLTTSQVEPPLEEEPEVITADIDPPVVEEPEVITSQVEPPRQEVTAEISWFGDTWFPWHLELEDRRRR